MFNSILSIICFLGISFAQIQYGGVPAFYGDRTSDINFITVDKSQVIDRDFHPMVFQFGSEYDVNINFINQATLINEGNKNTYLLGIESRDAFAIALN